LSAAESGAEIDRAREEIVGSGDESDSPAPPRSAPAPERIDQPPAEGGLPLAGYMTLTVPEIIRQAGALPIDRLREVRDYEKSHRRRKTLLTKLERMLRNPEGKSERPAAPEQDPNGP
jgi:hypothetical protein